MVSSGHRYGGFAVLVAEPLGVHDLAPSADERADADDVALVDVRLHYRGDAVQAAGAEPNRFRFCRECHHGSSR